MGRIRVFFFLALLIGAALSQAADYRLVIASDDPAIRKAAAMVVFERTGKLKPEDRITSITFSAEAIEPNCLVSLDPASGKAPLALSPDVEVYQGKVMIAGTKPTKKVIPAHIAVDTPVATGVKDGKLNGMMQPIIQQVNNLPWPFIVLAVGIVMGFIFMMNRRSQQYTTSMSKEAKNLYLETVGRITDRLERIEQTQERLVKNPPVVRTFKAQIEDFEGRLGRIEKLAKDAKEEIGRASAEISQSEKRHDDLIGRIESTKSEATKTQSTLKQESDALRAELKLILKSQDDATSKLNDLEDLKANDNQILDRTKQIEAALEAQESQIRSAQAEHLQHLQQLQGELATMRANQEALAAMPKELELVSASIANLPAEFESVRSQMPKLDGIETQLDSFREFGPKLDHIFTFGDKLNALPEIQNAINSLRVEYPNSEAELNRVHESLLLEIESLSGKIDESDAHLSELISAHKFEASSDIAEPESTLIEEPLERKKSKRNKHNHQDSESAQNLGYETIEAEPEIEAAQSTEVEATGESASSKAEFGAEIEAESHVDDVHAEELEPALDTELPEGEEAQPEPYSETEAETTAEAEAQEFMAEQVEIADVASPEAMGAENVNEVGAEEPTAEVEMFEAETTEAPLSDSNEAEAMFPEIDPEVETQGQLEEFQELQELASGGEEPEMASSNESQHSHELAAEEQIESEFQAKEIEYRYAEPEAPSVPEFSFNNAIKKMTEEQISTPINDEHQRSGQEAPLTFKLDELPTHLETFEDAEESTVLQTLHLKNQEQYFEDSGNEAAEMVLKNLEVSKSASESLSDFDAEAEADDNTQAGHWSESGGSSSRTWGSESSRPLELVNFEGELKPLTPIETAPIGDTIGAMVFGQGRIIYACGKTVNGFWPGKEDRHVSVDFPIATEDWRLALKGQNVFVVEDKKVKIVSTQGWFVLEQFSGEYHDQLLIGNRWAGLRNDNGPVIDFRDLRGQLSAGAVRLEMDWDGVRLASNGQKLVAGSKDGRIFEVAEFGTELIAHAPNGGELIHLSAFGDGFIALMRVGETLECWKYDGQSKTLPLDIKSYAGNPIQLGNSLYLADLDQSHLVSINLKKMTATTMSAFEGVTGIRRMIGVQHKSQHDLFVITTDSGKKGGRLVMIDAKSGKETTFGSVGLADVNLIAADHHVVLSTSSQYQNVIRVLEPFPERIAA